MAKHTLDKKPTGADGDDDDENDELPGQYEGDPDILALYNDSNLVTIEYDDDGKPINGSGADDERGRNALAARFRYSTAFDPEEAARADMVDPNSAAGQAATLAKAARDARLADADTRLPGGPTVCQAHMSLSTADAHAPVALEAGDESHLKSHFRSVVLRARKERTHLKVGGATIDVEDDSDDDNDSDNNDTNNDNDHNNDNNDVAEGAGDKSGRGDAGGVQAMFGAGLLTERGESDTDDLDAAGPRRNSSGGVGGGSGSVSVSFGRSMSLPVKKAASLDTGYIEIEGVSDTPSARSSRPTTPTLPASAGAAAAGAVAAKKPARPVLSYTKGVFRHVLATLRRHPSSTAASVYYASPGEAATQQQESAAGKRGIVVLTDAVSPASTAQNNASGAVSVALLEREGSKPRPSMAGPPNYSLMDSTEV